MFRGDLVCLRDALWSSSILNFIAEFKIEVAESEFVLSLNASRIALVLEVTPIRCLI